MICELDDPGRCERVPGGSSKCQEHRRVAVALLPGCQQVHGPQKLAQRLAWPSSCCSGIRFPKNRRGSWLQRLVERLKSCFVPQPECELSRASSATLARPGQVGKFQV